jgi:hypothetical protein
MIPNPPCYLGSAFFGFKYKGKQSWDLHMAVRWVVCRSGSHCQVCPWPVEEPPSQMAGVACACWGINGTVLPDFTPTSIPSLEETLKGWLAAAWGEMREGQWAGMGEEEWCPQTCSAEGDRKEEEGEAREEVVSLASQRQPTRQGHCCSSPVSHMGLA